MKRQGSAVWQGNLKDGKGEVSAESGVLRGVAYSFAKRFGDEKGTNPEELIAAAHAACFSMALSGQMEQAGLKAERIATKATATMEKLEKGWTVTGMHLEVEVRSPGADKAKFEQAAQNAKAGCPVSRLLNTNITMQARLA